MSPGIVGSEANPLRAFLCVIAQIYHHGRAMWFKYTLRGVARKGKSFVLMGDFLLLKTK